MKVNSTTWKTFFRGRFYFIFGAGNLNLSELNLRKRFAATDRGVA